MKFTTREVTYDDDRGQLVILPFQGIRGAVKEARALPVCVTNTVKIATQTRGHVELSVSVPEGEVGVYVLHEKAEKSALHANNQHANPKYEPFCSFNILIVSSILGRGCDNA